MYQTITIDGTEYQLVPVGEQPQGGMYTEDGCTVSHCIELGPFTFVGVEYKDKILPLFSDKRSATEAVWDNDDYLVDIRNNLNKGRRTADIYTPEEKEYLKTILNLATEKGWLKQ